MKRGRRESEIQNTVVLKHIAVCFQVSCTEWQGQACKMLPCILKQVTSNTGKTSSGTGQHWNMHVIDIIICSHSVT